MVKNFRELLSSISHYEINQQKEIIEKEFDLWKGNHPQIDDVLIIGVKV